MEKVMLGYHMATRWTDPTMLLVLTMVPYMIGFLALTGYLAWGAVQAVLAGLTGQALAIKIGLVFVPYVFTWFWWCFLYHSRSTEKDVDTSKFVIFRDKKLGDFYKHRRIPIAELLELHIDSKIDWNPNTEGGDCYKILLRRNEFVNYKPTWRQIFWLYQQFFPKWMIGSGLGHGSSSGKSIAETTKEIDEHYNKGNDVFSAFLGPSMVYTCGVWHEIPQFASDGYKGDYAASANDGGLEQAQYNKMKMVCEKLQLKKGETLCDIGCGWGTLARHAVTEHGAQATGVTLSREGKIYCDMAAAKKGVQTDILHCDYRDIPTNVKFDKISSIEMAEHVGVNNFANPYLKTVRRLMGKKDSMFLMQVSGLRQGSNWEDVQWGLFMGKYTFPGADASTPLNWYVKQCELAGFEVHSVETIGRHYSYTLHKWYDRWMSNKERILKGEIDAISEHVKGERLFRLNEFTWAWCTIAAGQGSATCYQILMHPNQYDYPRDQWVDPRFVSGNSLTGVGLNNASQSKAKRY